MLVGIMVFGKGAESSNLVPVLAGFSLLCAWLAQTLFPFSAAPATTAERRSDWLFFGITALVDSAMVAAFDHVPFRDRELSLGPAGGLLALGVWEFGAYWAHRLAHTNALLWRFHALHHAPARLTVLNNFRLHPFDLVVKDTLALGAVGFCGFDASTLLIVAVVKNSQRTLDAQRRRGRCRLDRRILRGV